jgi:uncharacterized membrane protein YhdT
MNPIFLEYPILFLQRATNYDGGEEGSSIPEFFGALGRIWVPLIVIVIIIWVIKQVFNNSSSENDKEDSSYTPKSKNEKNQEYYDKLFEEEKKKKEDGWNFTRNYFLYEHSKSMEEFDFVKLKSVKGVKPSINFGLTYTNFDILNLSHYSNHLERIVLHIDEKTGQIVKLKECWTYDGRWRQGYWTADYNYSDKNWREKTMNQFIDTTKGDIQP